MCSISEQHSIDEADDHFVTLSGPISVKETLFATETPQSPQPYQVPVPMAGRIMSVSSYHFPESGMQMNVGASPQGQCLQVLSTDYDLQSSLLPLATKTTLGVELSALAYKGRALTEVLSQQDCLLRVRFWNTGPRAFEPKIYGNYITVERELLMSHSKLSLCNQEHKCCSSEEADLARMLRHFNVRLEHPLLFAGPDIVSLVLKDVPTDLYQLAVRSSSDLHNCRHECSVASNNVFRIRESKRNLKVQLVSMQQKYVVCKQLQDEIEGKQKCLDRQLSQLNVVLEEDARRKEAVGVLHPHAPEHERSQLIKNNKEKMDNLKMALKSSISMQNDSRREQEQIEKDIQILTNEIGRLNSAVIAKARQQDHGAKKDKAMRRKKVEVSSKSAVNTDTILMRTKSNKRNNTPVGEPGEITTRTPCLNASVEMCKKKKTKIKHTPAAGKSLALNCSSTDLATDLRDSRAQKSELVQKKEDIEASILAEQANSLRLEKELEQCHTLSNQLEMLLKSDSNKTAKAIAELQKCILALQEFIQALQQKLAKVCATAEANILSYSNDEEGVDLEVWLPPLSASVARDDVPADPKNIKLDAIEITENLAAVKYDEATINTSIMNQVRHMEETEQQIAQLKDDELRFYNQFKYWRDRLFHFTVKVDTAFRRLLFIFHIPAGYLKMDHDKEELLVYNIDEVHAKYSAIALMFALMEASQLPFCLWDNCDLAVAEGENQRHFLHATTIGAKSLKHQQLLVLTSQRAEPWFFS